MTAADFYRRPERDTSDYRQSNVDRTKAAAGDVLARMTAARWFDEVSRDTMLRLSRLDLGRLVQIPSCGPMKLVDWVSTRVMSVAAHGLDVALTLGLEPWTTRPALDVTCPVLVSLLGTEPPAQLGWDDRTLLAAGTGRRALTSPERAVLGMTASARAPEPPDGDEPTRCSRSSRSTSPPTKGPAARTSRVHPELNRGAGRSVS